MKSTVNSKFPYRVGGSVLLIAAFFIASFLRLYNLSDRPMHVDEAVHAVKFGELLEHNNYKYDPIEYHGPSLNYLTLIPAFFSGSKTLVDMTESTLRIVPVMCGILMLAFFGFLRKNISDKFLALTIILISFSSILIFYNRYYIQESLLAAFTFCLIISLYKYLLSCKLIWILLSGLFAGLMFASKETSIISFGCLFAALLFVKHSSPPNKPETKTNVFIPVIFLSVFLTVALLFFSSFFSNWAGPFDSIRSIVNYFNKAGHFPEHIKPWHYYFSLILFRKVDAFYFTEVFVLIFFVFGSFSIISRWRDRIRGNIFVKIIFIFTLLLIIIYSLIPYKTPWSMLTFWIGCTIISAYGISEAIARSPGIYKTIFIILTSVVVLHQVWQSYNIAFTYSYHPQNPFVYSQSTGDVLLISDRLKNITNALPEKNNTFINVTGKKHDYWPLPWYLRSFKNVAWDEKLSNDIYSYPIILTSPDMEPELVEKLYSTPPSGEINLYIPLFDRYMELRPGVEIRGYIRKDTYDKYLRNN